MRAHPEIVGSLESTCRRLRDRKTNYCSFRPNSWLLLVSLSSLLSCTATAQQHSTDCWLELQSKRLGSPCYGINFFGTNPSVEDLQCEIRRLAAKYDVPVEIIAGICSEESYGGYQF